MNRIVVDADRYRGIVDEHMVALIADASATMRENVEGCFM
jgi:hypothetical protein